MQNYSSAVFTFLYITNVEVQPMACKKLLLVVREKHKSYGRFCKKLLHNPVMELKDFLIIISCSTLDDLKNTEGFLASSRIHRRLVSNNIEPNSLTQRPALSNSDDIAILYAERRTAVNSNILVALLKTTILGDVVQIVTSHNNSVLHLCANNQSLKDAATNAHVTGERALLVNIRSLNSGSRSFNSETDVLYPAHGLALTLGASDDALTSNKYCILALIGLLVLIALDVRVCSAGSHTYSTFYVQIQMKMSESQRYH